MAETNEEKVAAFAKAHRETTGYDPAALRCAYGDASSLVDAIIADMTPSKPLRGEAARNLEAALAALRHAADAIWKMRESVEGKPE